MVNEKIPLETKLNWLSKPSCFTDQSHVMTTGKQLNQRGMETSGETQVVASSASPQQIAISHEPRQLLAHPPVQPILKTQTGYSHLPNRFAEKLYLKYPFLLPKHKEVQIHKTDLHHSSYLIDYRNPKDVIDEMVVIRRFTGGGGTAEALNPPLRFPQVPYVAFMRESLSKELEAFIDYEPPPGRYMTGKTKKGEPPELVSMKPPPRRISEYQANINGTARYMKNKKIYTLPAVLIHHRPTLDS